MIEINNIHPHLPTPVELQPFELKFVPFSIELPSKAGYYLMYNADSEYSIWQPWVFTFFLTLNDSKKLGFTHWAIVKEGI